LLAVLFCGLITIAILASPGTARGEVTGLFGLWWGAEEIEADSPMPPGIGMRGGVRPHQRVAVLMEGYLSPYIFGAMPWNLLWGVRLNPVLRAGLRLDLDVKDGSALNTYSIIRIEATLLGSLSHRVGMGPRVRFESQPVAVRNATYLNGKIEKTTVSLEPHGHQLIAAVVLEADAPGYIGHLAWDIGGGVVLSGNAERAAPLAHFGFTWTLDLRDHRRGHGSL
jgi:hypothetical protein